MDLSNFSHALPAAYACDDAGGGLYSWGNGSEGWEMM